MSRIVHIAAFYKQDHTQTGSQLPGSDADARDFVSLYGSGLMPFMRCLFA
ncbi:MAG: hypothetical protein AB8B64_26060 [Granulosicoccus sp.]